MLLLPAMVSVLEIAKFAQTYVDREQKFQAQFGVGHITTEEFTPFELAVVRAFEWDRINFSSPEKQQRVANLYQTTVESLAEHRKQTRRKLGVHF